MNKVYIYQLREMNGDHYAVHLTTITTREIPQKGDNVLYNGGHMKVIRRILRCNDHNEWDLYVQ